MIHFMRQTFFLLFFNGYGRFKNGQGSNLDGGNYRVHENGTLEISTVRKEDQGKYTCVATNILGKAENTVRLEVKGRVIVKELIFLESCLLYL